MSIDWDEVDNELAAKNRAASIAAEQKLAKAYAEGKETPHQQGVRLGWWDEDGNPIVTEDDEDDEDAEDEE